MSRVLLTLARLLFRLSTFPVVPARVSVPSEELIKELEYAVPLEVKLATVSLNPFRLRKPPSQTIGALLLICSEASHLKFQPSYCLDAFSLEILIPPMPIASTPAVLFNSTKVLPAEPPWREPVKVFAVLPERRSVE